MNRVQRILSLTMVPVLVLLLIFRLYLQAAFPVIGDEAYYFFWGHHFSGGYYDLPPMIGWWERFFTFFSEEPFWLRIPNLLVVLAVVLGMRDWLSLQVPKAKATTVSLLYFFSPIPFLAILISHDVALLLFTFFSALLFYRGYLVKNPKKEFFFSGVLWGVSFLSKYFAVFVLPFYLIWHFTRTRHKRSNLSILYFILGLLPFLIQHLHWNANHCWSNFVFNLVTRQQVNEGPVYRVVGFYLIYLLILITPVFWFDLFKSRLKKWFVSRSPLESFFLGMWLVPISLFGVTALLGRGQGLHWYFPYIPFFFLWIGLRYSFASLKRKLRMMMYMSGTLCLFLIYFLHFPESSVGKKIAQSHPLEFEIAFHGRDWAESIATEMNTALWGENDLIVSDGYTLTSLLHHELHRYFQKDFFFRQASLPTIANWGGGSRFGRVFDWTVDYLEFEGKNVAFITGKFLSGDSFSRYFDESRISQKSLNGVKYWIYFGRGFHANEYVNEVMKPSWKIFYPEFWLEKYIPSSCQLRATHE
jgi:hypothetical protein